jgi:hypothetical protein
MGRPAAHPVTRLQLTRSLGRISTLFLESVIRESRKRFIGLFVAPTASRNSSDDSPNDSQVSFHRFCLRFGSDSWIIRRQSPPEIWNTRKEVSGCGLAYFFGLILVDRTHNQNWYS